MQNEKNKFLKDFLLEIDFIIEADLILGCNYLEKEKSNMTRGILVLNQLLFYIRKQIYFAYVLRGLIHELHLHLEIFLFLVIPEK